MEGYCSTGQSPQCAVVPMEEKEEEEDDDDDDLFIDLFGSAPHVSGDKLAHLQEHFSLYIQLWYNAPTLLPTGDKAPSQPCPRSAAISVHCTKVVYTVKKCS